MLADSNLSIVVLIRRLRDADDFRGFLAGLDNGLMTHMRNPAGASDCGTYRHCQMRCTNCAVL